MKKYVFLPLMAIILGIILSSCSNMNDPGEFKQYNQNNKSQNSFGSSDSIILDNAYSNLNPNCNQGYTTKLVISDDPYDLLGHNAVPVGTVTYTNDADYLYITFILDPAYINQGYKISEVAGMGIIYDGVNPDRDDYYSRHFKKEVITPATTYTLRIPRVAFDPDYTWRDLSWVCHDVLGVWSWAKICRNPLQYFGNYFDPSPVKMVVENPYPGNSTSYFKTTISNSTSIPNGSYVGWCVDIGRTISPGTLYNAMLWSSYDPDLPSGSVDKPQNLDLINWIINNISPGPSDCGTITWQDIQMAIWNLMDNTQWYSGLSGYNVDRVNCIMNKAIANGEGFIPGCDQKIAMILIPGNGAQVTIIQITLIETPNPPCNFNQPSCYDVWGLGNGRICVWKFDDAIRQWYWVSIGYEYCCN